MTINNVREADQFKEIKSGENYLVKLVNIYLALNSLGPNKQITKLMAGLTMCKYY